MPLSSLCVFESTGRTSSFIQAARELGISPSAVSDSIRKLEESIDIQLFERTTREVNLTPKGRLLVEHLTPQCSPALASRIGSPQALYEHRLIQCDVQMLQCKGWFEANHLMPPHHYALRFDRSHMAIAAAANGMDVVLESSLLAERELQAGPWSRRCAR